MGDICTKCQSAINLDRFVNWKDSYSVSAQGNKYHSTSSDEHLLKEYLYK